MLGAEDIESVNSELRYITIELMKIAAQRKIPFEEAAREFLKDTMFLQKLIETAEEPSQRFAPPILPLTRLPHVPKGPRLPKMRPGTQ